ncbi:MAG: hypothetical protein JNN28_08000 [Saprospiraceae bacterium]|nr:hypothetical protein [Saprospiraceae bacterium]
MPRLLTALIFLSLINAASGQNALTKTITGNIRVTFFMTGVKTYDSYVTVKGTDAKAAIDSNGHFILTKLREGPNTLQFHLWQNTLIKDTTLTIQHDLPNFSYHLYFDCDVNEYKAFYDIHYGQPKLLIAGGDAPSIQVGQEKFEAKFGVTYYYYGCLSPADYCLKAYNQAIFNHLNQTHGRAWKKEVRKDVFALKKRQ